MIRVLVWNEFKHEQTKENVAQIYPDGMHNTIKGFLEKDGEFEVKTATLFKENCELDESCGLTDELLENTDVLLWWGHTAHNLVPDEVAKKVQAAVQSGMGFIALHSAHHSKPFKMLMGTTCNLSWREDGDMERVWVINPAHPIAQGVDRYFELEGEETYAEPFDIPEPDELVFGGWYEGGEIFRSGCTFKRGNGKIFYFQPGHETFPTYYNETVQTVIKNAIKWVKPVIRQEITCPHVKKIEK